MSAAATTGWPSGLVTSDDFDTLDSTEQAFLLAWVRHHAAAAGHPDLPITEVHLARPSTLGGPGILTVTCADPNPSPGDQAQTWEQERVALVKVIVPVAWPPPCWPAGEAAVDRAMALQYAVRLIAGWPEPEPSEPSTLEVLQRVTKCLSGLCRERHASRYQGPGEPDPCCFDAVFDAEAVLAARRMDSEVPT